MFNTIKRMINSNKYTVEYLEERIETFYLVDRITKDEYLELKEMLKNM